MDTRDSSPPWRILGNDTQPEAYIPLPPGSKHLTAQEILNSIVGAPSAGERARYAAAQQVIDATNTAKLDAAVTRHAALLDLHKDSHILTVLLTEHAPHRESPTCAECHGCEEHYDDWGQYYDVWPCVPWRTIDEHTPNGTV